MGFSLFFFSFIFFMTLVNFFVKKLLSILLLEGFMLVLIFYTYFLYTKAPISLISGLILSVFMVLGSVFSISLLVGSSRNTSIQFSGISLF